MSFRTSPSAATRGALAVAIHLALLSPAGSAHADAAPTATASADAEAAALDAGGAGAAEAGGRELPGVEVAGVATPRASSPKYTAPLRDTPQTITVIDREIIDQQNLLTLRDVLSTLPGITFGAGEGGGGYGDSINLRGFNANNDITVDGIRDSAQYSRTDPFNLDQIELVNGANSVFSGAGSVGGTINLVSKRARLDDFYQVSAGVGTDNYRRVTADLNHALNAGTAVRLNLMGHENDVPDRAFEDYQRFGIAPSIGFGLDGDTSVTLSYVHQRDDNTPQYGIPFFNGRPLAGIDLEDYFGYANLDQQLIIADSFTALFEHRFSDHFSLRNTTKYQAVDQITTVSAPQGTYCLANNLTPLGASCGSTPPGFYQPSGPRGNRRDTENSLLGTQTDLLFDVATGGIQHTIVSGVAFTREKFQLETTSLPRNANRTPAVLPITPIAAPDPIYRGPVHRTITGATDGDLENAALYVFDTLQFSPQWLFNAGARYEINDGSSTLYTVGTSGNTLGVITGAAAPAKNRDNLFSYRAGLVYKPIEAASLYLSYANSETPSKAAVNGSCVAVSTTTGPLGTANCNVDPEEGRNLELGVKWDLFEQKLSFTAAIFRNERTNYRVNDPGNPDNPTGVQQLDGEARVDGLTAGLTGLLAEHWSIYANVALLDSEVLQGVSDFQAGQGLDFTRGDELVNTPRRSGSVWTTYDLNARWQFGYGITAQGDYRVSQHSATNVSGPLTSVPGYAVHRALAMYRVHRDVELRLNVNNVFEKIYFTRIRPNGNGWATQGDARQFVLTANLSF